MDPLLVNTLGPQQLIVSSLNKKLGGATTEQEGVTGEPIDQLGVDLDDEELLKLSNDVELRYRSYEGKITPRQLAQQQYYMGKQGQSSPVDSTFPIASNILFEAVETFIPAALAKNPEPVVWADNTPEGNELSNDLKTLLQYHSDQLVLRAHLSRMVRSWIFNFVGVIKIGWNPDIEDIEIDVRDPRNFIFDPNKGTDCYGDKEGLIGERIVVTAGRLIEMFPKWKAHITVMVDGKLGTDVTYTEWWTDDYCFYTFKGEILDKHKNPHFNYPQKVEGIGIDGSPTTEEKKGNNHFARPKKPYVFLNVFTDGKLPHDMTGLIEQNIPNQNRISKREWQIDVNLDRANNSIALAGGPGGFTQETAKQAAMAMQKGNPILVPGAENIEGKIARLPAPGIPAAVFTASDRDKQDLRSIFGTEGISSMPAKEETTARGMILNQQFDNTRIGGGIGERLEQVADNVFNWFTQMYKVYYDVPHFASIMGQMKAVQYVQLQAADLNKHVTVSVAPDSMKSHDEITEMNQAMQLWEAKAIDIKTLLTRLNFPDPQITAGQAWLYQTNPQLYGQLNFPELSQQIQQLMAMQAPVQPTAPPQPGQAPGGIPPEQAPTLGMSPASSQLSQVPLPQ